MGKQERLFPIELLVYVFDRDEDGTPMYAIATSIDEIPEENDGEEVANYVLNRVRKFSVKRLLV
jgi:protein involved in sex pheromone biosynthesis